MRDLAVPLFGLLVLAACGGQPPPPPRTLEVPRVSAEESCAVPSVLPRLPTAPPADPYRLTHPELMVVGRHVPTPVTFLCDLPDRILAVNATQTVDGGRRVVGGSVVHIPRSGPGERAMTTPEISPRSKGCLQGELACSFDVADKAIGTVEMLREQRVHTGGWVHGANDLCRAVPDDTIAVCSTPNRMAYVELGCDGKLALGLHDTSLPRVFDLDVEVPVARLTGRLEPSDAHLWRFVFTREAGATGPAAVGPKAAALSIDTIRMTGDLVLDGESEPCWAFALARR